MKFSIKFLLALLVLGALLANYFVVKQKKRQIREQWLAVLSESDSLIYQKRHADGFIPLYRKGIEAEKLLNVKYKKAFEANKMLPYSASELKIENPELISYRHLPLLADGEVNHNTFRVYVPESQPVWVVTEFENGDVGFVASKRHSTQLTPGQHIVDYRYDYSDKELLELFIDDQKMFSTRIRSNSRGYSASLPTKEQRDLRSLPNRKRICTISPSFGSQMTEESRVIGYLQGGADEK